MGHQFGANPLEVVELAVVGHQNPITAGPEWLPGAVALQINDREPRMGHANAAVVDLVAKAIRTAMGLDRGHVHQQLGIDRITRVVCENASDAAHVRSHP